MRHTRRAHNAIDTDGIGVVPTAGFRTHTHTQDIQTLICLVVFCVSCCTQHVPVSGRTAHIHTVHSTSTQLPPDRRFILIRNSHSHFTIPHRHKEQNQYELLLLVTTRAMKSEKASLPTASRLSQRSTAQTCGYKCELLFLSLVPGGDGGGCTSDVTRWLWRRSTALAVCSGAPWTS
jgi:hypothetical protein